VIAPSIDRSTLSLAGKINYPVDLIEVKRWLQNDNEFLLINRLEPEIPAKVRPVRGLQTYDRVFYETGGYNKISVGHFFRYIEETAAFVRRNSWPLEPKFNKLSTTAGSSTDFSTLSGSNGSGRSRLRFSSSCPRPRQDVYVRRESR